MMREEEFGTADDYVKALAALLREGIAEKHVALVQAHFKAPHHIANWAQIARAVGYASGNAVNLHYGMLASRVAHHLGVVEPPNGFWLFVLIKWAEDRDASGHTAFVLRRPIIEALTQLGILPGEGNLHAPNPKVIPSWGNLDQDLDRKVKEAQTLSPEERHKHLAESPKYPEKVLVNTTVFLRNQYVISEVLARANGVCESCHAPAPFIRVSDGAPYLEVHHRIRLADEGEDTVLNAIALCPNCHRKAHYG
jgi:5-methylcytosine-specific restriction endonuclease McrA